MNLSTIFWVVLFTFVWAWTPANAQAVDRGDVPAWVLPAEIDLDASSDGAADGVYYVSVDEQARFTGDGQDRFYRIATKVTSRAGLESAALFESGFNPANQKLVVHEIKVLRQGEVKSHLDDIALETARQEEDLDQGIQDGYLTVFGQIPDVRVGDIVLTSFTRKTNNPLWANEYFDSFSFNYSVPVEHLRRRILAPSGVDLSMVHRSTDLRPEVRTVGGDNEYLWNITDVAPATPEDETGWEVFDYGSVSVSTMHNWSEVAEWGMPLYAQSTALTEEMEGLLDQIRATKPDRADQITWAIRYVQDEIRYVSDSEGLGAYVPRPPKTTLQNRYGDCKDKAVLLVTLLEALGIDSYLVYVHSSRGLRLPKTAPQPTAFDHVIVGIEEGDSLHFVDATLSFQGGVYPNIEQPDYGFGLPLKNNASLVSMKASALSEPNHRVTEHYILPGDGRKDLTLEIVTERTGSTANSFRQHLAKNALSSISENWLDYYKEQYPGLTSTNVDVSDDRDANKIVATESYSLPGSAFRSIAKEFPFHAEAIDIAFPDPSAEGRENSVVVPFPIFSEHNIIVEGDENGYGIFEEIDETVGPISFKLTHPETDERLHVIYELRTTDDRLAVDQVADYNEAANRFFSWESATYEFFSEDGTDSDAWYANEWFWIIGFSAVMISACFGLAFWTFREDDRFEGQRVLIPVPTGKFIVLSVLSVGYYAILWVWRSWRQAKDVGGFGAFLRAVFLPFAYFAFFDETRRTAGIRTVFGAGVLCALLYFALSIVANLGDRIGLPVLFTTLLDCASWILLIPTVLMVAHANRDNVDAVAWHSRWTGRTFVGIMFGVLVSGLVVWAAFLPA